MKISLIFTGHFAFEDVKSGDTIALEPGTTVSQFLTAKGIRNAHQRFVIPIINGEEKSLKHIIEEGDEVRLFLPVGGG